MEIDGVMDRVGGIRKRAEKEEGRKARRGK
jgi:hypothetical protein